MGSAPAATHNKRGPKATRALEALAMAPSTAHGRRSPLLEVLATAPCHDTHTMWDTPGAEVFKKGPQKPHQWVGGPKTCCRGFQNQDIKKSHQWGEDFKTYCRSFKNSASNNFINKVKASKRIAKILNLGLKKQHQWIENLKTCCRGFKNRASKNIINKVKASNVL